MIKRYSALILASALLITGFTGCGGKNGTTQGGPAGGATPTANNEANKYAKEIKVSSAKAVKETVNIKDNQFAKLLKEKFNLVIETTEISTADYVTKMSLLFASGEPPEYLYSLRPEWKLNEWTEAGYIKGFTVDELKTKLPNYMKVWTDEEWANVYGNAQYSDGKVYYLPGKRAAKLNMTWVYRKDTFDALGLAYPKSTDDMYNALKAIKEKTGKVPYVSASTGSGGALWAFSGFLQSFGMPELAIRELSYVDPVSKTFVPYAFSESNYREFLKYMNKLYKEGLIWKEFATATTEQTKKFQTQGNGFALWGYPEKLAEYDNISKSADANAKWDWSKDMVSASQDKIYFKRDPYFNADGIGFYSKISDEKLNRVLDYVNWAMTEEGQRFNTFGVEGLTYEMKDGKPVYMEKMISPTKATGEKMGEYGIVGSAGWMVAHPAVNEVYKPVYKELEKTFLDRRDYNFFMAPIMPFTEAENKKLADIQTSINDTRDEYAARFIMGQLDPANEADWNKYIETLNKLGLQDMKKVRADAYNRANKR